MPRSMRRRKDYIVQTETITAPKALSYIYRSAPGSYTLMALMGLLNGCASVLSVWATEQVFTHVQKGYTQDLFVSLAVYAAAFVLSGAYSIWYIRYHVQFFAILNFEETTRQKLHGKSRRISNEVLETPRAYAFIRQAYSSRQNLFRYGQIYLEAVLTVVQAAMVGVYISALHPLFLLLLPLSAVPTLLELLYDARLWKKGYETVSQCQREETEYEKAVTDSTACKESRLTGANGLLIAKWKASRRRRSAIEDGKSRKKLLLKLALSGLECAGSIGGLAVSAVLLHSGAIDLPAFTASVAAYTSLSGILWGLSQTVGNAVQYGQMVQPYFRYWNMPERGGASEDCSFHETITLRDVSFAYPNQRSNALDGVSVTIKRGEVVAVVGENGAGKSTLVNVLLGLYQPSSGTVLYDGQDISEIQETALHRRQSALSQTFCRYQLSAGDNIAIGDFSKGDSTAIEDAIRAIFPEGEVTRNTPLGKEFGGRELSGGQWQQISCARSFYKDSDFIVLDEPTSAIDPLREKALIDSFFRELQGKTGIIVTHRLGAVSLADRILVLQQGKIVEDGTHAQLLAANGLYASLWNTQASAY